MAVLLHPLSAPTTLPEFDIYGVPATQMAVERGWFSTHYPSTKPESSQLLEFDFVTSNNDYIHMDKMILRLKMKVKFTAKDIEIERDGKMIKNTMTDELKKELSFANYPIETVFSQKDLFINGKAVTSSEATNGYRAILDTKLGFSSTAKDSWMSAGLYSTSSETGFLYRHLNKYLTNEREIDLMGVLHFDLAFQNRAILGGAQFTIKLHPNTPDFYLMYNSERADVKVTFTEARLDVWRSRVTDFILQAHLENLENTPAKYPITRTSVKAITLNPNVLNVHVDNAVYGQLPNRIFIGFVPNKAFNGDPKLDPFAFHHFDIDFISVIGPYGQIPNTGYRPVFDAGAEQTSDALIGLYAAAGQLCHNPRMKISRDSFAKGEAIFGFSMSPDLSEGCSYGRHSNPIKHGNVRIEVHFKRALPETVTMIVYSQFDNIIYMNKDLQVATDYQ